ncbi:MAG: hypothetical protein K6C08_11230 [Oscillospiraceae bacterium]|nr:hypothetical protein [Oscillospiraceae bacterium]
MPLQEKVPERDGEKTSAPVDLDEFQDRFIRRYRLKKKINAVLCFFIFLCGVTAVLYSVFVNHMNLFDRLRYLTFNITIFTSLISLVFVIVSIVEIVSDTEVTHKWVYYLRLSSAATELVTFIVVMVGLTPLVPDQPDITSYTGAMMHLVIPIATISSFVFNDAPVGRVRAWEPLYATWFITVYALVMFFLFGTGILPGSRAPYTFLDFENASPQFILTCFVAIYATGYGVSALLCYMNKKLSWLWFYDFRRQKHGRR